MSYTNETTHYGIPLPLGTDKTTPMDYNTSMEALDTAVFGAVGDAATAVSDAADAKSAAQTATSDVATLSASLAETDATVATHGTAITSLGNKIDDVDADLSDAICSVVESTATATYAHKVGEYFWYNDTLYKATQSIAVGATIVPNTNCVTVTVTDEITVKSVSVTADGVKSYAELLPELYALVDRNKIGRTSVLVVSDADGIAYHTLERVNPTNLVFARVANITSTGVTAAAITLGGVGNCGNVSGKNGDTFTYSDNTSTVKTAGSVLTVVY